MESKLEKLLDDDNVLKGVISYDNGFMINDHGDAVDYLMLEYKDRHDVYLNLFDGGVAPYRDILVKGSSNSIEVSKRIATKKLNKEYQIHKDQVH